jgi:hypothetical protein
MNDRENETQQKQAQQKEGQQKEGQKPSSGHRLGNLTILQLMGLLALAGLLLTWVLRHYFAS